MDMQGHEESRFIETDQIDRLDLPKEGTYLRCDKDKARDYLGNRQREFIVKESKPMTEAGPFRSYSSVVNKIDICMGTNNHGMISAAYLNKFDETVNLTMAIKAEYSIHPKERYNKTTENNAIAKADNDNYLQAA